MFITFLFITCLLILVAYSIKDLHASVALQMKWSPESKISWTARTVYRVVEATRTHK